MITNILPSREANIGFKQFKQSLLPLAAVTVEALADNK